MRRYEALQEILAVAGTVPIVCNIGHPSQELFALADRPENFYMLGSMGLATSIAHGIALARHGPVIAIDGDAATTMNMGGFATIGHTQPANLIQIIIDNGANGSTGFQPSFTAGRLHLDDVARAAGIDRVTVIEKQADIGPAVAAAIGAADSAAADGDGGGIGGGSHCIVIRTETGMPAGIDVVPLDAPAIRDRFMTVLRDRAAG